MFWTEDECKEIINGTGYSSRCVEFAKKSSILEKKYKKLVKRLSKITRFFGVYLCYPEIEDDILVLKKKDYEELSGEDK